MVTTITEDDLARARPRVAHNFGWVDAGLSPQAAREKADIMIITKEEDRKLREYHRAIAQGTFSLD